MTTLTLSEAETSMEDGELLRAYVGRQAEDAFAALVARYAGLVYSAALRQLREPTLAEEVTQAVFIILARRAARLRPGTILPGWLLRTTRYTAANVRRHEQRRQHFEREAMNCQQHSSQSEAAWERVAPLLDEALVRLCEKDRNAVALRFFEGRNFKEVGAALGLTENTARMRDFFNRRGVRVSADVLAIDLAAHAVHAAPAGVSLAISAAVSASGAALQSAGTLGLAKLGLTKSVIMTTAQKLSLTGVITLAVGTGIFEAHRAGRMRVQRQEVERQVQPLTQEAGRLRQEREALTTRLRGAQAQIEVLQRNTEELARLRGEVARLRRDAQELAQLKATMNPTAVTNALPRDSVPAELAARVALLQQNLQQRPERRIPELRFAEEKDWLEAAKLVTTESDIDVRKGLSLLRTSAKLKFGLLLRPALQKYTETNNGDLPTDLLQLKPCFTVPVDDAILKRYQIVVTGNTGEPGFDPYKLVVRETAEALPDSFYDAKLGVSLSGSGVDGGFNVILPGSSTETHTSEVLQMRTADGKVLSTFEGKGFTNP